MTTVDWLIARDVLDADEVCFSELQRQIRSPFYNGEVSISG